MKHYVIACLAVLSLSAPACAQTAAPPAAAHFRGDNLAPQAKLGLSDARAIALEAFPGKVVDEELEQEAGGSGLRYSFDIQQGKVTHEVGVDAVTGQVLENSDESNDDDNDKDGKEGKKDD